mgnify:CR=1 FL=1|jgi:hypothetical protein
MISVCIYCGRDKSEALDECEECLRIPNSHTDVIYSIIMSYSEEEPYLNFIDIDEIEVFRESIINGSPLEVEQETFREAEEAYSAVGSMGSPQVLKYFSKISQPVMMVVLLVFIAFLLMGT